jgi:hypothetical protein
MKKVAILMAVMVMLFLTGCGEKVVIENGEVGKQLTTSGLEKEIRTAGAFRMDSCFGTACPKLVRLSIAETTEVIPGKFFIKKSDLAMELELSLQYSVKKDEVSINEVFRRVKAEKDPNNPDQLFISEKKVYNTFIKPVLRDTVRVALNNYTIEQIIDNLTEVRVFVENQVKAKLSKTPIKVISLSFSKIGYPKSIMKAKEDFAKIELEKATKMKAIAAELEIAKKEQELKIVKAKMALEVDKIVADRMNPQLAKYMLLEAINTSAENRTPWAITGSDVIFRETIGGKK